MATPIPRNQAHFSVAEILTLTGGAVVQGAGVDRVTNVSTDTRVLDPGGAFVAIGGGHDHLATAMDRGACVAIVEREAKIPEGLLVIRVASTVAALGDLARAFTRSWRASGADKRVVAITGSAGKTTTRVATQALLDRLFPGEVHASSGNLNNRVGLPMVLFGLAPSYRIALVEIGTNRPGEIAELTRIAEPNAGAITLVAAAHTEELLSLDGVAVEKGALLYGLSNDGSALGNGDDHRVRRLVAAAPAARRATWGTTPGCHVRITQREPVAITRSRVALDVAGRSITFETSLLGEAGALACAAAVAIAEVGLGAEVDSSIASRAFGAAGEGGGRLAPRELPGGPAVIDDSYNANPASTGASIRAAAEIARAAKRRLVLVLGEMRELGAESHAGHDEVGRAAAASGAAMVIAVRGDAERIARSAAEGGVEATFTERVEDAAALLLQRARPGDLILVKGSRSTGTERIVAAMSARFEGSEP